MSGIYGALGLDPDSQREFVNTIGQRTVYDAVNECLAQHNMDVMAAMRIFVERDTPDHKFRYLLPGGGRLQRKGRQSRVQDVKASGSWDVALPLYEYGAKISADRVAYAYMRLEDLDRHIDTVVEQDVATLRFEMLAALLNSAEESVEDEHKGTLLVEPLANGDSVKYPPVLGSETDATENNYIETGYLSAAISDTNNPLQTVIDQLEKHFGTRTGGSRVAIFINNAQTAKIQGLTEFTDITLYNVTPGDNTAVVNQIPEELSGGTWRVIGTFNGAFVVEWRFVPANYLLGVHLDAPKPLLRRIDPADTGLTPGLQLVNHSDAHPFTESEYSNRFGLGCGNRLNGVVIELGNGGSFTVPSGF